MNKKFLIVTADDYGMCKEVDDAIDLCIECGFVTTTNVIVNMDLDKERVKQLRKKFSNISIGIHWNVTAGKPITDAKLIPSLIRENGDFYDLNTFIKLYNKGKISKSELELELNNQYKLFESLCGKANYWNTHQNSSLSPKLFKVFSNVAKKFDIKCTRNFQRLYIDFEELSFKKKIVERIKKIIIDLYFTFSVRKKFKCTDSRIIVFNYDNKLNIQNLSSKILKSKSNIVELVCHPATNSKNKFFGTISDFRMKELEFFSTRQNVKIINENNISLINFENIL